MSEANGQETLYKKDMLRINAEHGDTLWITDELDQQEVSLSREQLRAVMPILQKWLSGKQPTEWR